MHGGHADEVRAQPAQGPDLGRRLEVRPGQPGVDAVGQARVDPAGHVTQGRRVRGARRPAVADARRQVELVGQQHRLAHGETRPDPAGRVRQQHRPAAGRHRGADAVGHRPDRMALVEMDTAEQDQHAQAPPAQGAGRATVPGRGRRRKAGQPSTTGSSQPAATELVGRAPPGRSRAPARRRAGRRRSAGPARPRPRCRARGATDAPPMQYSRCPFRGIRVPPLGPPPGREGRCRPDWDPWRAPSTGRRCRRMVDQTALPRRGAWLRSPPDELVDAIRRLAVGGRRRSARPARSASRSPRRRPRGDRGAGSTARRPRSARPTAVNLAWGVERALARLPAARRGAREALAVLGRRRRATGPSAGAGADLLARCAPGRCGCSPTATPARWRRVEWGTALGVVAALHERGRLESVCPARRGRCCRAPASPRRSSTALGVATAWSSTSAGRR